MNAAEFHKGRRRVDRQVTLRAPAKVNLHLEVLRNLVPEDTDVSAMYDAAVRASPFEEDLETLFQRVESELSLPLPAIDLGALPAARAAAQAEQPRLWLIHQTPEPPRLFAPSRSRAGRRRRSPGS